MNTATNVQKEIYKSIPNYEGLYEVSNIGNVKSLFRKRKNGLGVCFHKERIIKPKVEKTRYYRIGLCKEGERRLFSVHQLVAMAFLGHVPNGYKSVINHINHDRQDNRVENLEITSQRINSNKKHIKAGSTYVGVYWNKLRNKWCASIYIDNKSNHIGYFKDDKKAGKAYNEALCLHNQGKSILPVKKKYAHKTLSRFKGVTLNRPTGKWVARIQIGKKHHSLGYFVKEEDASFAYQKALSEKLIGLRT